MALPNSAKALFTTVLALSNTSLQFPELRHRVAPAAREHCTARLPGSTALPDCQGALHWPHPAALQPQYRYTVQALAELDWSWIAEDQEEDAPLASDSTDLETSGGQLIQ